MNRAGAGMDTADVVIVGAGPAGSTAATVLAQRGWDVLVVDRATFPRDKTCGDGLTPRAVAVLDRLESLPASTRAAYQRINGACTVAPNGGVLHVRFSDYDLGLPDYGLVVPRFELDHKLLQQATARGARFRAGWHADGPLLEGERVIGVAGHTGGRAAAVRAPLTILATGAGIGLLRAFGVLEHMPPGVNAIRGYFSGIPELADEFEFYFEPQLSPGYAWVFPLGDGRANIGLGLFGRRPANQSRLLAQFIARHPRLAAAQPDGPVKGYPLRTDFPRYAPAGPGYLLAGEALGLVHPVTGEGIDLAMESAELAAHVADASLRRPNPGVDAPRAYRRAILANYGSTFRGLHLLERLATRPPALNRLIGRARSDPYLARAITGINLGAVSPWTAFSPRTWLALLR